MAILGEMLPTRLTVPSYADEPDITATLWLFYIKRKLAHVIGKCCTVGKVPVEECQSNSFPAHANALPGNADFSRSVCRRPLCGTYDCHDLGTESLFHGVLYLAGGEPGPVLGLLLFAFCCFLFLLTFGYVYFYPRLRHNSEVGPDTAVVSHSSTPPSLQAS